MQFSAFCRYRSDCFIPRLLRPCSTSRRRSPMIHKISAKPRTKNRTTRISRIIPSPRCNVFSYHFGVFAFSPSSTRRRLFKMSLRLPMADTARLNFWAIKALSISSRVTSKVVRHRRASRVGLRGAGLTSFPLHLSWRGSDSIHVLLFSLTLRSGRATLRYYPRRTGGKSRAQSTGAAVVQIPRGRVDRHIPPTPEEFLVLVKQLDPSELPAVAAMLRSLAEKS